jgi:hypothetical protein
MSKARALVFSLVTQPPSEGELIRRQQAEGRRTGLIGGLHGEVFEPAPLPTQAPRPTGWEADQNTID